MERDDGIAEYFAIHDDSTGGRFMSQLGRGIGAFRDFTFGEGIGRAEADPPGPAVAGRLGMWRFTYSAGPRGVADGGAVRFTPPNGFSAPQFEDMTAPGYCSFSCDEKGVRLAPSLWEPELGITFLPASLTLTLEAGSLAEGGRVEIVYGWTPSGIPGARAQLLAMPAAFHFTINAAGDGGWELLPGPPVIDVRPEAPAKAIAVSPAQAVCGEPFALRIVVRDRYGNVVPDYRGKIEFRAAGGEAHHPGAVSASGGVTVAEGFSIDAPGVRRIEVEAEGLPPARTPPIRAEARAPERRLLFGDPHCMSGLCVGEYPAGLDARGIVDYVHTYARDAAGVDFGACTSLGYRMDDAEWRAVCEGARDFTEPGRYVALPAYEWFGMRERQDGNRNVYFLDDDGPPKYHSRDPESDMPEKLWAKLEGMEGRALTIPHHSASAIIGTRWEYHNPRFQRLVEIYSIWGNSEAQGCERPLVNSSDYEHQSVEVALEKGFRLGIVAGSDTHTSQPGYSNRLRLKNGWHGGYACVWAESFDREGIFRALWERRCYGTTGARIILEFTLGGEPMGSEIALAAGAAREVWVRAEGTGDIAEVAVIKNARAAHLFKGGGESFEGRWTDPAGRERGTDYYYVRVKQADGEMAWSSPVWVEAG
ncbi:MAG TPA: hypothetical protein DDZ83_07635 [Nitrospinae bacterium]|nr:hypothetical protein [Nitrospinota bacterium]